MSNSKFPGQGRAKGQIHLIGYNFTSNYHREFRLVHILVYEKLHQIWPRPWLLTLTLKSLPKVKIFETYQLRKTVKVEGESQPKLSNSKCQCQGQGRAKGKIHLIAYNFASNCHRDFKLGSYFSLWKGAPNTTLALTFDLDKFPQGQNFWNI